MLPKDHRITVLRMRPLSTNRKSGICTTHQSCPWGYIYFLKHFLKHVYTFLCTKSMQVVDTHSSAVKVKLTTSRDLGQRRTFHFNGGWLVQVNYCNKCVVINHEPCIFPYFYRCQVCVFNHLSCL